MAIMTPKELGARVREIREARGLTQEQVAELTDLATDTVRRIELGYYGPSFSTMVKIAVGFGLTVGQLMRDEVDPAYQFATLIRALPDCHQKAALAVLGSLYIDSLQRSPET